MLDPPEAESSIRMSGANIFINQLATRGRVLHLKGLGSVVIALKTEQIKYFVPVIYLESRDSNFVTLYHNIF